MNDNDIIKALEKFKCVNCNGDCAKESYEDLECPLNLVNSALDLINRQKAKIENLGEKIVMQMGLITEQKAEIERLNAVSEICGECHKKYAAKIEQAKSEAIKEFAERLKELPSVMNCEYEWLHLDIDNLVKEMTEGVKKN